MGVLLTATVFTLVESGLSLVRPHDSSFARAERRLDSKRPSELSFASFVNDGLGSGAARSEEALWQSVFL